jgi:hypothetical protein
MIVPFQPSHVNIDCSLIEAIANAAHFIEKLDFEKGDWYDEYTIM